MPGGAGQGFGMHTSTSRTAHRIVIAGGGIAALEALVALSRPAPAGSRITPAPPEALSPRTPQPPAGCRITLAPPAPTFAYRPLAVREPFGRGGGRRYAL